MHACDVHFCKLTAMHCVTKIFYRHFHKWQYLHGNERYPYPNPNINPNSNHVENLNRSLQFF